MYVVCVLNYKTVRDVLREVISINHIIGPSTELCRTPYGISSLSETVFLNLTHCVLLCK